MAKSGHDGSRPADGSESAGPIRRVREALRLFTQEGKRYTDVRDSLMTMFDISDTQAANDIRAAYDCIKEEFENEQPHLARRVSLRFWDLSYKAEQGGDLKSAIAAMAQLAKMHGLNAAVKVEHSGAVETHVLDLASLTREERDALRKLTKAAKPAAPEMQSRTRPDGDDA
jgi:hypothetical protein